MLPRFLMVTLVFSAVLLFSSVVFFDSSFYEPGQPSFSQDGRMVIAIGGDLWVAEFKGDNHKIKRWTQLTNGSAIDKDPVWMGDNQSILFASDRNGEYDLWQIELSDKVEVSKPTVFYQSEVPDTEPTVADDGTVVWVHGVGPDANIWIKKEGKEAKKLTKRLGAEYSPAITKDGKKLAYIFDSGRQRQLILKRLGKKDTILQRSGNPEFPAWSPDGSRLSYTTRGSRGGVWVTNETGQYFNLLSQLKAASTWLPDGSNIAIRVLDGTPQSYNGDPDWEGKRYFERQNFLGSTLHFIPSPIPPDHNLKEINVHLDRNENKNFVHLFDQVVSRLEQKYLFETNQERQTWQAMVDTYRKQIEEVDNQKAFDQLSYQFLKAKPKLRKELSGTAGVSSAHPLASEAGKEILEKGGNVVDAAIAVSFALGVVEPDASGIGGYGEMMIYLKEMDAPTCIEFLTTVPEAASLNNAKLNPIPNNGPVKVNIPGTVAGMELAWKKYGSQKIKWADLIIPAIKLAEEGFTLDESFPTTLAKEKANYLRYPGSRALFFRDNLPLKPGDHFKNPDLAWTLKQIAKEGANAFYKGEIAKRMVADLASYGNVMSPNDLARYYAVEREPVHTTYRGHSVYSGPPPVSGGAILIGRLNMLELLDNPVNYQENVASIHGLIEASKLAPSTRNKIADPGLWPIDLKPFSDKKRAQRIWNSCFNPLSATIPDSTCNDQSTSAIWGDPNILEKRSSTGTTSFAVVDADGNMVSVTQTLGTWGGNFHVTPGLGFLYNDKLGSYSSNPNNYNARIPFARNVTSITPTLVFEGEGDNKKPLMAVGAAGNAWIGSAVYQIIAGVIDQDLGPQAAIEQPRFLLATRRAPGPERKILDIRVLMENAYAPGVIEELRAIGHNIQLISNWGELRMGYSAAIVIKDGMVRAGADPRRSGEARVVEGRK